jgi:FMN-dependent NADH-azoreductase
MPPGAAELSDLQQRENAMSEALVSQFLAADVIVIGAPLYNFSVPSQLKAWIDRVAQVGRTFKYTDKGPVGLASGKTVVVASTRGGVYSTSEGGRAMEHQESYLQTVFGFFGITDVRFVRAEGIAMGDAAKAQALASAEVDIRTVAWPAANDASAVKAA